MSEFDAYRDDYGDRINAAIAYTGQPHEYYTRVKAEYLCELLDAELPDVQTLKVLDVGCGHGDIHDPVTGADRDIDLTGIDVAETVIEEARTRHPGVAYDVYDGHRLPYADGSFDAAYTICVMHHVPTEQWQAFLVEMRRVVRPGGLVIVFEHNPLNPLTRHLVNTCPIDKNAVLLKSSNLMDLYGNAGLETICCRFIIFTPIDRPLFKRFDRWIGWLPFGAQYYVAGRVRAP